VQTEQPNAAADTEDFEFAALLAKAIEWLIKEDVFEAIRQRAPQLIEQALQQLPGRERRNSRGGFEKLSIGSLSQLAEILSQQADRDPNGFARMAERWPCIGLPELGEQLLGLSEGLKDFNRRAGGNRRHDIPMDEAQFDDARAITVHLLRVWPFGREGS